MVTYSIISHLSPIIGRQIESIIENRGLMRGQREYKCRQIAIQWDPIHTQNLRENKKTV